MTTPRPRAAGGGAVLVTGASGGIGSAVARRLAVEFPGAPLVLGYRSTEPTDLARELAGERPVECVRLATGRGGGDDHGDDHDDDEVAAVLDGIAARSG